MVFNRILIVLFLFFSYFTFAQEDEIMPMAPSPMPKKEIKKEVSFMKVEQAPIFPGCEKLKTEQAKRTCLQNGISDHVAQHFDVDLINSLGLAPGRKKILVVFKIDEKGNVTNIKVIAPHPVFKEEAIRIIKKLPKMLPGKERGQPITIKYALPINFEVEDDKPIKEGN